MKAFINGILLSAIVFLVIGSGTALSKVYKYVDSAGQIHYTNDPVSIPPEYREQLDIENEIMSQASEEPRSAGAASSEAASAEEDKEDKEDEEELDSVEQQRKSFGLDKIEKFRAQERALEQEYSRLLKEREAITASQEAADMAVEVLENNRRVEELNKKFADFHKRQKKFKQTVKDYNLQVRENMRKKVQQLDSLEQGNSEEKTQEEAVPQR
jgi:chromosome segregation ATPase